MRNRLHRVQLIILQNLPRRDELILLLKRVNELELDHRGRNVEVPLDLEDFLAFLVESFGERYLLKLLPDGFRLPCIELNLLIHRELHLILGLSQKPRLITEVILHNQGSQKHQIIILINLKWILVDRRRCNRFGRRALNILIDILKTGLHLFQLDLDDFAPNVLENLNKDFLLNVDVDFAQP